MKTKKLFFLMSICSLALLASGCSTCPVQKEHHGDQQRVQKHKHHKQKGQKSGEPIMFYQTYEASDINNVQAKMFTGKPRGPQSEMGTIIFTETDNGLEMNVDLIHLRPGKIYTAQVYQCGACNDNTCCSMEAMSVDLPQLKVDNYGERLQQSYVVRGLTAAQLNNAKLILTRDKGHKAAWGQIHKQ